jgi:hypothetical protein
MNVTISFSQSPERATATRGRVQLVSYKYLMYILTDYKLVLTKDTKDKPDLSSEKADPNGIALARTRSNSKLQIRLLVREGATK